MKGKNLTQSLEDYLEAIFRLENSNRVARVKEIAGVLGVKMPSVTGALKTLKSKGLVEYEKNSYIVLTPEGKKLAKRIDQKHQILNHFLKDILQVDEETAGNVACEVEHVIDMEIAKRISNLSQLLIKHHGDLIQDKKWLKMLNQDLKEA